MRRESRSSCSATTTRRMLRCSIALANDCPTIESGIAKKRRPTVIASSVTIFPGSEIGEMSP